MHLVCRDEKRANEACDQIKTTTGNQVQHRKTSASLQLQCAAMAATKTTTATAASNDNYAECVRAHRRYERTAQSGIVCPRVCSQRSSAARVGMLMSFIVLDLCAGRYIGPGQRS